ncbi:MAG: dephospho-CoA kinase [Oscillospiraceae bacterium]
MNELNLAKVIGLTGQSGSGKTTVCEVFRNNGFSVINADLIARQVMEKGEPCLKEVHETFTDDVLAEDGSLNRKKLADVVFSDTEKLNLLNTICYPYITEKILIRIKALTDEGKQLILLDAPTLFESRADDFCELIISVIADEKIRINRIIERDNINEEKAKNRLNSQHDDKYYADNSDFIIINNKDLKTLISKAKEVSDKIKEYYEIC